jgi:PD-(D/E)XK nuclease superfamily
MKFPLKKISASSINCYLNCPLSFKLIYIDGYEPEAGKALDIGSIFDLMFKSFHEGKDPYEEAKKKFFSNPPTQEEIDNYSVGKKLIDKYKLSPHLFISPKFDIGFGIHYTPGIRLTGYLDGIDNTLIGTIGIEVKTTTNNWTQEKVDEQLQATIYAYYLHLTYKIDRPLITYLVFNKKTLQCQKFLAKRDKTDFEKMFKTIDRFIADVEAERFDRNPNHPYYCACRKLSKELSI